MSAPIVLSLRNVRKDRPLGQGAIYSLVAPHLDIRLGEKILITGPSGCGKSTLLDIMGMVLKPDAAEHFSLSPPVAGSSALRFDIARAWRKNKVEDLARWRRNIGYVLQTGGLLPFIPVRENIMIPRRLLGLSSSSRVDTLAATLGITDLLHKLPAQLSVGERQRAAIARALAAEPAIVLADEPTAALDPANAQGVLALFSRTVAMLGTTLVLVSHAPEQMKGMGFRRLHVRLESCADQARGLCVTRAVLSDLSPGTDETETQQAGDAS